MRLKIHGDILMLLMKISESISRSPDLPFCPESSAMLSAKMGSG